MPEVHGLTREEALELLKTQGTWNQRDMITMISSMRRSGNLQFRKVLSVEIGDLYFHPAFAHPVLVLKVLEDSVGGLIVTTNAENSTNIGCKIESRFSDVISYPTITYVESPLEIAKDTYMFNIGKKATYTIRREFRNLIKKL